MNVLDVLKALGVAVLTLIITLAASFPMVAFYAYVIEPGHPQSFYNDAALWIAPWSSHILGPLVFFAFNFWLARRAPKRNAFLFAVATVALYIVVDFGTLPLMGIDIRTAFTLSMGFWLSVKLIGALLGAYLGAKKRMPAAEAVA